MEESNMHFVSVVIPLLNEEESLGELYEQLTAMLEKTAARHELIFIDDGSTDGSLALLQKLRGRDQRVKIIAFT